MNYVEFPSFGNYLGKYFGFFALIICIIGLFYCSKLKVKTETWIKWIIISIIVALIFIYSTYKIKNYNDYAKSIGINVSETSDSKLDAWSCAVLFVKDNLKSPSTADFCMYPEATIKYLGDERYEISGYVDSENGFGATLRTNFTVTLTLTENGFKDASILTY